MFTHSRTAKAHAEEASIDDVRAARDRALASLGLTLAEIQEHARLGEMSSARERMVWLAYKDLG